MLMDAIDLSTAVVHNSPREVASWPATVQIERLTMRPGQEQGLSFEFSPRLRWPDYTPPGWTPGGEGLQYTVWAGCQVDGVWHVAGIIQMWRTRASTGAPILSQWRDWCYDPNRWGPMVQYQPRVGDKMIFFLTAGNARKGSAGPEPDVTSVRERSNVVMVALPSGDTGEFSFIAPPEPIAVTPGGQATALPADVDAILEEVKRLSTHVQNLTEAVKALKPSSPV